MQFDFGRNWIDFSKFALTPEMAGRARKEFEQLFKDVPISGKSFLDIGFGQGMSLLFAKQAGANVWGNDINPKCKEALSLTASIMNSDPDIQIVIGSILDEAVVKRLKGISPDHKGFDIVHSWGVLHHTGDMKSAVHNASTLVAPNGHLVVALYNRHCTSTLWLALKYLYGKSPRPLKALFTIGFIPVIALAKFLTTGKNPFAQNRGMNFYYNVIDWIGGYPYEYASKDEVIDLVAPEGFSCCTFVPAEVPTGCNEFVFKKKAEHAGQ
jgi:2-polyprenyl-3-methyl-5-hydroxy-6-metoxy-1,4-benzoquinol methylase